MLRTPKFEGGIFSTCNQTDLRKYICWSTGIKTSLLSSFYSSRSPLGTKGASHPCAFLSVFPNQQSEKTKWAVFLSGSKLQAPTSQSGSHRLKL